MGWKNVKDHYRIKHIVSAADGCIYIGTAFATRLICVKKDGNVKLDPRGLNGDSELARCYTEMLLDVNKLRELIKAPDKFVKSISVYTYDGGEIIKKKCEQYGWFNCTHDGEIMWKNFFTSKTQAVMRAKELAGIGVKGEEECIVDLRKQLAECVKRLGEAKANLAKLEADYPDIASQKKAVRSDI